MNLTEKIQILNRTFQVKEVSKVEDVHDDGESDGFMSLHLEELRIITGLTENRKEEVFWHEIVHAINAVGDLSKLFKSRESEEEFTIMFTRFLIDTVHRNNLII